MAALRGALKQVPETQRVLSLDAEWEYGSIAQFPPNGRDKVALIQLGFEAAPGSLKAILIHCRRLKKLPDQLLELFRDNTIVYVAVRVGSDASKIAVDIRCTAILDTMRCKELGMMAKDCGVVTDAMAGLQTLVLEVLRENMDKDARENMTEEDMAELKYFVSK